MLALLLAAATLLSCTPQTDDPTPPDDGPEQPPVTDPTDSEQGGDDPMQEEITYDGRYNPHASRAEGQSDITLREYSIVDGTLIQPDADDSDLPKELEEVINTYMTKYDPVGIKGYVTNFQHSGGYSSHYAGLEPETAVSAGDTVEAGQVLGTVGETAMIEAAQEPHLHFEVYCAGEPVDPAGFLY
jgi:hypothetical protein